MQPLTNPRHIKSILLSCLAMANYAHAGLDVRAILAKAKADVAAKKTTPANEAAQSDNT